MDHVISYVHLSGRPSACPSIFHGKICDVEQYLQMFKAKPLIPAILIYTMHLYHFIPLWVILTLAESHKVSRKQNLLSSFSVDEDEMWCWSNLSWISWYCFWLRFTEWMGEIMHFYWLHQKPSAWACIWMFINWFCPDLLWCSVLLDSTGLVDLDRI